MFLHNNYYQYNSAQIFFIELIYFFPSSLNPNNLIYFKELLKGKYDANILFVSGKNKKVFNKNLLILY